MSHTTIPEDRDLDGLRLLALSRIPRCQGCPIFRALEKANRSHSLLATPLPQVSETECSYQHCAPLVTRLSPEPPA